MFQKIRFSKTCRPNTTSSTSPKTSKMSESKLSSTTTVNFKKTRRKLKKKFSRWAITSIKLTEWSRILNKRQKIKSPRRKSLRTIPHLLEKILKNKRKLSKKSNKRRKIIKKKTKTTKRPSLKRRVRSRLWKKLLVLRKNNSMKAKDTAMSRRPPISIRRNNLRRRKRSSCS